ncbi:hypothetical protein B0H16DRAFT_907168 [Mycena metata]|uniref:Nephrocystin 3-like N-terminal domain-containing protein n=1 Tax=Mycena metata TaxID=1033252 RepID=A0AAD7IQL0_9AGAR|nr:hypothetical protein B0H16DRAFT_907168 [Mycena metata]
MDAAAGAPLPASSVFDETLQRFMRNLDPVDVDWLGRITASSWEPLIVYLEALNRNHRNSSGARKLLSRVRCFVDTLRPFLGCVDMVVSSNGSIVGIIWGSLRVLIEITHKFTEYFSIISDTLETISVELPIFQDYVEKLYTESHTVQKAVAIVFEDILTVFLSIRNTFIDSQGHPRSSLCISLKAFRQDMEKIIMHLEKHRKIVEVHVEHAERMANKEEREESVQSRRRLEAKILSDEKRASELTFYQRIEKFQALLDAPKCWGKHATTVQVYKQPQCWLLNNHQYKKWSTQNCGLLWCHSKPGAGKTVLR